jgi:hypothetical protein
MSLKKAISPSPQITSGSYNLDMPLSDCVIERSKDKLKFVLTNAVTGKALERTKTYQEVEKSSLCFFLADMDQNQVRDRY